MEWLKFIYEGLTSKFNNRELTYIEKNNLGRCKYCTHKKYNSIINFFFKEKGRKEKVIQGMYCNKCKCILSLKLRSRSKCPLKLWMVKS